MEIEQDLLDIALRDLNTAKDLLLQEYQDLEGLFLKKEFIRQGLASISNKILGFFFRKMI
jgi:hypothetical protein